tara:strand:- start:2322 stop:4502 length:2181 start_codon:yes stop_codon:yes gene_type:complete
MPISEELQRRIASFTGDMVGRTKGAISNREMDMFGPYKDTSADVQAMRDLGLNLKGAISNREMELFRDAVATGNVENVSQVFNILNNTKGVLSNREMQLFEEAIRTGSRSNLENVMSMVGQTKGAISDREMELFRQASPSSGTSDQDLLNKLSTDFTQSIVNPTRGAISNREMELFRQASPSISSPTDFAMDITSQTRGAISDQEMQLLQQAEVENGAPFTEEERESALLQIQNMLKMSQAPYYEQAQQIAGLGSGVDTSLIHAEVGDTVIPPDVLEGEPQLESYLEQKFIDYNIDPESRVVGSPKGIMSLDTGLQEMGFFKKVGKFLKKVVAPIASVAQFVPGPWQVPAALISKANTVRNVVRGDASPLALATVFGPTAVGGKLSENIANLKAAGDGSILKGLGSLGGQTLSGIGQAVMNPMDAIRGIPSLMSSATLSGQPRAQGQIDTDRYELRDLGDKEMYFDKQTGQYLDGAPPSMTTSQGGFGGIFSGGGADDYGNYGVLGDIAGGITDRMGITNYGTGTGTDTGTGTGGGGLGGLALAGGLAGTLGKLAYEEAKKDKGVQMTPLTSMDATGRYNIEAEIARRMGQQAPNPVEFGLLPAGTFPTLSGGQPLTGIPVPLNARYGGGIMAYANGGDVSMAEFEKMNGGINGEGTEISDEIPAMLSDGEFVMTGQAVRGAGKYEMATGDGGIMTLIPSLDENRERGTNLMYRMMEAFSGQAVPA